MPKRAQLQFAHPQLRAGQPPRAPLPHEDVQAATGVATHEDIPGGVERIDGADRAQALGAAEGVQQHPRVLEHLDLPRPCHAAHHKALLLLGVPHGAEARQPAARVVVVPAEQREGADAELKESTTIYAMYLPKPILLPPPHCQFQLLPRDKGHMGMVIDGSRLDLMVLEAFSNLPDPVLPHLKAASVTPSPDVVPTRRGQAWQLAEHR